MFYTDTRWHKKILPPELANVVKIVYETLNYVQSGALNHCILKDLCNEIVSELEVLLHHSNIRLLTRWKVLRDVFALHVEPALFLRERRHCHATHLEESNSSHSWLAWLTSSICQMQGGRVNVIKDEEKLSTFRKKLPLWRRRIENDSVANFPLVSECLSRIQNNSDVGGVAMSMPRKLK